MVPIVPYYLDATPPNSAQVQAQLDAAPVAKSDQVHEAVAVPHPDASDDAVQKTAEPEAAPEVSKPASSEHEATEPALGISVTSKAVDESLAREAPGADSNATDATDAPAIQMEGSTAPPPAPDASETQEAETEAPKEGEASLEADMENIDLNDP